MPAMSGPCTPSCESRPNVCQNCGKLICASSQREKISRPTIFKYLCPTRNWLAPKAPAISRGTTIYLKMVGRLFFSLWLDAQSTFPQFWQTLGRLLQLGVHSVGETCARSRDHRFGVSPTMLSL